MTSWSGRWTQTKYEKLQLWQTFNLNKTQSLNDALRAVYMEEEGGISWPFDRGKGVPSFDEMMDFALVEVDFDDPTTNVRGRRALAITKPTPRGY